MLSPEDRYFLLGLSHIIKFNQFNRVLPTPLAPSPKRNFHRKINSLDFHANLRTGMEVNIIRKNHSISKNNEEIVSSNDQIINKNISFEKIDETSINNEKTTVQLHFDEASFIKFPEDGQSVSLLKTERTDLAFKDHIRKGSIFDSPERNYDLLGDEELDTAKKIVNALEYNEIHIKIAENNNNNANNDEKIKFLEEERREEHGKNEEVEEIVTLRKFPSLHLIENYDDFTLRINGEEKNHFAIPKLAKTLKKKEDAIIFKKDEKKENELIVANDKKEESLKVIEKKEDPLKNDKKKLNVYQKTLLNEIKQKENKYVFFNGRKINHNLMETISNLERLLGGTIEKTIETSPSIIHNNLDRGLIKMGRKKKTLPINFDLI